MKPDFDALRTKRNAAVETMLREMHIKMGGDTDAPIRSNVDPHACYCSCGTDENLCEHDFQGWRDIVDEDGAVRGGETVCSRCGMGAMSHSLRCGM